MTIAAIEAIPVRLPTHKPVRFANGEVSGAEHVLVRVRADDGAEGIAEASPRPMTYGDSAAAVVHAIGTLIAPRLVGLEEDRIELLHHELRHLAGNVTARAALDVALWDLLGKRAGLPVATLLGGHAKRVRVAHLLGLAEPDDMAAEAARIGREFGVRAFKVKVGLEPHTDVDRVCAVRDAIDRDAIVYLDANHGWRPQTALWVVDELKRRGVVPAWLEEPTPAADAIGRKWLVDRVDSPVVADESVPDLPRAAQQLGSGLCQWLSLKTGRTGFRASQHILGLAIGLGAEVVVGSQVEGALGVAANLHLAAAFAVTSRHPVELTSALHFADDIIEPLVVADGWMQVPDEPGLGVVLQQERLDRLRMD